MSARPAAEVGGAKASGASGASGTAAAAGGASASPLLSSDPAIAQTGGIARALSQSPPIDQAKVAALRAAVQMSSYAVDPQKIAGAMLRSL